VLPLAKAANTLFDLMRRMLPSSTEAVEFGLKGPLKIKMKSGFLKAISWSIGFDSKIQFELGDGKYVDILGTYIGVSDEQGRVKECPMESNYRMSGMK
jgi:hypothetical protein